MGERPGLDPITDIVEHLRPVFGDPLDTLIAEIVALGGRQELADRFGLFYWQPPSFKHELGSVHPIPDDLAEVLREIRDRRLRDAQAGGWEVQRLLDEAHGEEPGPGRG